MFDYISAPSMNNLSPAPKLVCACPINLLLKPTCNQFDHLALFPIPLLSCNWFTLHWFQYINTANSKHHFSHKKSISVQRNMKSLVYIFHLMFWRKFVGNQFGHLYIYIFTSFYKHKQSVLHRSLCINTKAWLQF